MVVKVIRELMSVSGLSKIFPETGLTNTELTISI